MAITTLLYGMVVAGRVACHQWYESFFVAAGQAFCEAALTPPQLEASKQLGYDGQFCYRLALNPFTHRRVEHGITIDNLPYRQQRIFCPVMAHLLAVRQDGWVHSRCSW